MRTHRPLFILTLAFMLSGCGTAVAPPVATPTLSPPIGACSLGLGIDPSDDDAQIRALLRAEGELMVSQQIEQLMALWADSGRVVDAKHTPQNESDDQVWLGSDAVRHRYVRIVFPGAPTAASPADMQIVIDGDSAVVTATTHIGGEISPAGDRWQLQKIAGCWVIERLVYNLEPVQ